MKKSTLTMKLELTENLVPVLHLAGSLDGTNYEALIAEAQAIYNGNQRQLLLNLFGVTKISMAGLLGLHSVAAIFNQTEPLTPEAGWAAIRAMKNDLDGQPQPHLKIVNPQLQVRQQLIQAGFDSFIEIYDDLATATAVFATQPAPQLLEEEQQQPAAHVVHQRKQPAGYLVKALNLIGILPKA